MKNPPHARGYPFEVGMMQLGGHAVHLTSNDSQLGRGETVADTARVLSRFVDLIMIRTYEHATLQEAGRIFLVPVINGLTNDSHPCQIMADLLTIDETLPGKLADKTICWVGDFNNMTQSWIEAANILGFTLNIACPQSLLPADFKESKQVRYFQSAQIAASQSHCVTTDTWISMGDADADEKRRLLQDYQVDSDLMNHATSEAIFLHCLPAHRGEEVTADVIDGPQSVIWDEAENRLHAQKAIMLWCLDMSCS